MAERTAINAPVQGTAADIIKLAIRFTEEDLKEDEDDEENENWSEGDAKMANF